MLFSATGNFLKTCKKIYKIYQGVSKVSPLWAATVEINSIWKGCNDGGSISQSLSIMGSKLHDQWPVSCGGSYIPSIYFSMDTCLRWGEHGAALSGSWMCVWSLTVIGGEFTVSGFDRSHEVSRNYHGCETNVTAVFPHQGPKRQSIKRN